MKSGKQNKRNVNWRQIRKNKHLPKLWLVKTEYKMYPPGKTFLSELMAKYWGFPLYSYEVLLEGLYPIREWVVTIMKDLSLGYWLDWVWYDLPQSQP